MENTCHRCGKTFYVKPVQAKRGRGKYCSFACWRPLSINERFYSRIEIHPNGCWIWTASRNNRGYGTFWNGESPCFAHQFSWEIANGTPFPKGSFILHSCDNPPCVNPEHLRLGTHKENMDDMMSKGRQNFPRGEKSGKSKYSESTIIEIRKKAEAGADIDSLSREFNISKSYIYSIIARRYWKHI